MMSLLYKNVGGEGSPQPPPPLDETLTINKSTAGADASVEVHGKATYKATIYISFYTF